MTEPPPSICKRPNAVEIAELVKSCPNEQLENIARRLAFTCDRLDSAIEGHRGWKEENAKQRVEIEELKQKLAEAEKAANQ